MKTTAKKLSALLAAAIFLLSGCCGRVKELERMNQEQASAIAGMNQEVSRLRSELDQLRAARTPSAGVGTRPPAGMEGKIK